MLTEIKLLMITLKRARTLLRLVEADRIELEFDSRNSSSCSEEYYKQLDRKIARRYRAEGCIYNIINALTEKIEALTSYSKPVKSLREYTTEEVQQIFIKQMRAMAHNWASEHNRHGKSVEYCLDGLLHSFAAVCSGATLPLCSFALIPTPYLSDRDYHITQGDKWFPFNDDNNLDCDIMRNLKYNICEGITK